MTDRYRLEFKWRTERQMEVTGTQTTVGVNYITVIAVMNSIDTDYRLRLDWRTERQIELQKE